MKRSFSHVAPSLFYGAAKAYKTYKTAKRIKTAYDSWKKPRAKASRGANRTLTKQRDIGVSYKRKLTRRKKRQISWVKKVKKAAYSSNDLNSAVQNTSFNWRPPQISGPEHQQVMESDADTAGTDFRLGVFGQLSKQFEKFVNDVVTEDNSATGGALNQPNNNVVSYMITKCEATIALRNTSEFANASYLGDGAFPCFVDIYECVASCDINNSTYETAFKAWQNTSTQFMRTTSDSSVFDIDHAGLTPYQTKGFKQYWTILKKTRLYVGPNETVNYNYGMRGGMMKTGTVDKPVVKGRTKDLIIVWCPTANYQTNADQRIGSLQWSKRYNFKIQDSPGLQQGYKIQETFSS